MYSVLRLKAREEWGAREPAWEDTLNRKPATKVSQDTSQNIFNLFPITSCLYVVCDS